MTPHRRERRRVAQAKYNVTEKGRATQARYRATVKGQTQRTLQDVRRNALRRHS